MTPRFLIPFRLAVCLLGPALAESGRGAGLASGFGADATPAEEALAAQPEPDGYFREMTGFWHGVPGLEALRARWEGFAGKDAGFAVLAALVSESEGKPEEALEKLQGLPGHSARWNEGRLLALLGREGEAVAVLSALVTAAERPEMGAAALIALTELECIRGDFTKALQRTTEAWESREEEGFRLRILERHLSLLVEAGKERAFLDEQVKEAESAEGAIAETAGKVMAVMADWFTADVRLRAAHEKLESSYSTGAITIIEGGRPGGTHLRPTMDCGILRPRGLALERLGQDVSAPLETAGSLAYQISYARKWPETLDGLPLLKQVFAAQPLYLSGSLFFNPDPAQPLPPLARKLADAMEPGVARRTLDLVERAWAGRATPEDAETLATILVEAPQLRRQRTVGPPVKRSLRARGWPVIIEFPAEEVIWNLSGESWTSFYRSSCRLAPLMSYGSLKAFYPEEARLAAWSQWRPQWPLEQESALTTWAWSQLALMQEATKARAAAIAGRMADPGDRFLFAARCRQKNLLAEWCRDRDLLRQVNSTALMQAIQAFGQNPGQEPPDSTVKDAAVAIAREMAGRMDLNALDLIRSLKDFSQQAQPWMKRDMQIRPVDPLLAETLGLFTEDAAVRGHWKTRLLQTVPHPLQGVPVSPSVERFRMLASVLRIPRDTRAGMYGRRSPLQKVIQGVFGGEEDFDAGTRPPELLQALETFPTSHPLKRQLIRWDALRGSYNLNDVSMMSDSSRRSGEQDINLTKALQAMAEEEQSQLSWHLVRAMLEKDAAKRALLLGLVQARSPLAEGVTETKPGPSPPIPAAVAGPGQPTPEGLTAMFVKMIADPAARQQLEPAGALFDFMQKKGDDAFLQSLRRCPPSRFTETAEHLMDAVDPLAARMAVILMADQRIAHQSRPGETAAMLLRALALFPDDPELLLAYAARHSGTETGRAAFRRGLVSLKAMIPFKGTSQPAWCGIDRGVVAEDAETASALAAFAERSRPATLPQSWVKAMEAVLNNQPELDRMTGAEVRSTAVAVVRYKTPWRAGEGSPQGWIPLLNRLAVTGRKEAAAAAAEALLSQPTGSLGYPGDATEPAPPWHNWSGHTVTAPEAEGWKWLELAGQEDPAGLADRLQTVAAAHPGDEHTALAALLALGRTRILTAEDVKMPGLPAAGRHRALAYASWLLPPDRLPAALVVESWEAEARVEFSDVSNGDRNFLQGSAYLDRLEKAGATQAVRRLLPAFVACLKKIAAGGFETYPSSIVQRLQRLGTPAQLDYFHTLLADHLKELPDGPQSYGWLAATLEAQMEQSGPAAPPAELARRVTLALESAAAGNPSPWQESNSPLWKVARAAAGDPRWHDLLRRLFARQPGIEPPSGPPSPRQSVSVLMRVLGSGSVIPDVALLFSAKAPGQGTLTWNFQGLMAPPQGQDRERSNRQEKVRLPWRTLATPLAGKFDALVLVGDEENQIGERMAARIEKLPATGEIALTALPTTGRLRLLLIQRDAPQFTAESTPLGFNTLPVLMDTSRPPGPSSVHPQGWQLLCEPCALTTTQWQINREHASAPPWPAGLALLLLDDSNQVCAIADLRQEWAQRNPESTESSFATIAQHQFSPEPLSRGTQTGLRIMGPPRRLALASSTRPSTWVNAATVSHPLPRFIVQESPVTLASATVGRFEILRFWNLPSTDGSGSNLDNCPFIRPSPLEAAWYAEGNLTVLDLEKDSSPRTLKIDVPPNALLQSIFWTGPKMHLLFNLRPDGNTTPPVTLLLSLEADSTTPAVVLHDFKKAMFFQSLEGFDIPGAWKIESKNGFYGILHAGGRLLKLNPGPEEPDAPGPIIRGLGSPQQALSATSFACYPGTDRLFPVLDWTDGTLSLRFDANIPPRLPRDPKGSSLSISHEGLLVDVYVDPAEKWQSPLNLNGIQSIGYERAIGFMQRKDGAGYSVVLLKKIRTTP
jgi:hypothetical protein